MPSYIYILTWTLEILVVIVLAGTGDCTSPPEAFEQNAKPWGRGIYTAIEQQHTHQILFEHNEDNVPNKGEAYGFPVPTLRFL